jgi:hypothetical protein
MLKKLVIASTLTFSLAHALNMTSVSEAVFTEAKIEAALVLNKDITVKQAKESARATAEALKTLGIHNSEELKSRALKTGNQSIIAAMSKLNGTSASVDYTKNVGAVVNSILTMRSLEGSLTKIDCTQCTAPGLKSVGITGIPKVVDSKAFSSGVNFENLPTNSHDLELLNVKLSLKNNLGNYAKVSYETVTPMQIKNFSQFLTVVDAVKAGNVTGPQAEYVKGLLSILTVNSKGTVDLYSDLTKTNLWTKAIETMTADEASGWSKLFARTASKRKGHESEMSSLAAFYATTKDIGREKNLVVEAEQLEKAACFRNIK